jgi:hypothetical protein
MTVIGWYYLHENGDLIFKYEKPEVEAGGFVKHVWDVDPEDRGGAYTILLEAIALGAKLERVEELAKKWGMTDDDCLIGAAYFGMLLMKDGKRWAVRYADSQDRFGIANGETAFSAMCELARRNYIRRGNRL